MKQRRLKWIMLVFALSAIMTLGACKKKVAPPPPPPPPPPASPTASLSASPNTVDKGGSTTLTWQTTNATDISTTIHPHPTLSETIMASAEVFFGTATDIYRPKKKA